MTDKFERVSALVDEQLDDKMIDALLDDPELQQQWARHHTVSDAIRGDDVTILSADFTAQVSAAIADEPTVLAPKPSAEKRAVKVPGKVVRMFRQVGQYAIAATVAAVAIVGVQQTGQQSEEQPLPVLNTNPVMGVSTSPVSLNATPAGSSSMQSQAETRQRLIEQRRRINAYFQDHELQMRIQQPQETAQAANQHDAKSSTTEQPQQ
ncbi:anti-sigma factor [Neiella marina]|uniref:Anti-sigma-E factor RseA n=1 Tax=Neiella holothuriorum TaxID=2870530 RepID=A0ABS7EB67_9GAMM|nr:RseA family anti-sigma factor [Neiella holothuriorum]MBW8189573.1 anti-sigma factor [Neiella holothuriorum]